MTREPRTNSGSVARLKPKLSSHGSASETITKTRSTGRRSAVRSAAEKRAPRTTQIKTVRAQISITDAMTSQMT